MPRSFVPGRGAGKIRVQREAPSSRMVRGHVRTGPSSPGQKPNKSLPFQRGPFCLNGSDELRAEGSGMGRRREQQQQLSSSHTPNALAFPPAQAGEKSSVQTTAGTEK